MALDAKQILIGIAALLALFWLFRSFLTEKEEAVPYSDVLTNENYKVKGQWDK